MLAKVEAQVVFPGEPVRLLHDMHIKGIWFAKAGESFRYNGGNSFTPFFTEGKVRFSLSRSDILKYFNVIYKAQFRLVVGEHYRVYSKIIKRIKRKTYVCRSGRLVKCVGYHKAGPECFYVFSAKGTPNLVLREGEILDHLVIDPEVESGARMMFQLVLAALLSKL